MPKEKAPKTAPKIKKKEVDVGTHGNLKLVIIFFIIGIFIGGFVTLFYNQQKDLKEDALTVVKNEQQARRPVDQKVQALLRENAMGKPIIAQVRDISIVENLPRYTYAREGDNVLLFDNLFVIYDEKEDKIVSVIPRVLLGDDVDDTSSDSESENSEKEAGVDTEGGESGEEGRDITKPALEPGDIDVEVRNGGQIRGFAGTNAKDIKSELGYATTATNASGEYDDTVIVILGGEEFEEAGKALQEKYDVSEVLTKLPTGEKSTEADIVVIVVE